MAFRLNSVCAALVGILAIQSTARFGRVIADGHHSGSFQISGVDAVAGIPKLETGNYTRLTDIWDACSK